jgi:transglutaminase-like putative cysteine protease
LFTAGSNLEILHTAPQPISIDREVNFTFAVNNDGTEDLSTLLAITPLLGGESYEVQASTAVPSAEQLRAAGTAYPSWVRERYLQFSSEISPRTLELARSLAEGNETPYDIAVTITDYLRNEIEYINQLPIPPADTEPLDWLLFEQKQGFCNYYATAEVIMLRSLGIPARLAVGYVDGEVENLGGSKMRFTVHQRDAHAWPEVYFPGIGWVEFEPTANQQPLLREPGNGQFDLEHPIQEEEQLPPVEAPTNPLPIGESASENGLLTYLWMIVVGVLLTGVAFVFLWRYRDQILLAVAVVVDRSLRRFDVRGPRSLTALINNARLPVLTRAYTQINQALQWLGATPKPGDTPRQRAAALSLLLPELRTEINALVEDYQDDMYGQERIEREERARVIMDRIRETAERLRFRRWLEYLLSRIRR